MYIPSLMKSTTYLTLPVNVQASEASRRCALRIGLSGKEATRAAAQRPFGREHAEPPSGFEGRPDGADADQTGRGAMPPKKPVE